MKQASVAVGIVGLLLGAGVGNTVSKYFARQHEHTTAVMVLLQFHLQRFEQAVQSSDCIKVASETSTLQHLADEIPIALPIADAQDVEFHHRILQLQQAVQVPVIQPNQCAFTVVSAKPVRQACADCHHDYR